MQSLVILASNILGAAIFIGGITLWVRFDQQGKTRRRELEHAERMRALELGRPLDDAAVARHKALGAIGVAVPITSLSAALVVSMFVLAMRELDERVLILAGVWGVCGTICLTTIPVVLALLRGRPNPQPAPAPEVSGITTFRNTGIR